MNDFSKFYEETYVSLKRFLVAKAPRLDRVDDMLQEIYVKMYSVLKKNKVWDGKAYLFKVAWNVLAREYKLPKDCAFDENIHIADTRAEERMTSRLTLEELWECLKEKDVRVQKCVYLYYLGMSLEEISVVLKTSVSVVKNDLYRTFKELREEFR